MHQVKAAFTVTKLDHLIRKQIISTSSFQTSCKSFHTKLISVQVNTEERLCSKKSTLHQLRQTS